MDDTGMNDFVHVSWVYTKSELGDIFDILITGDVVYVPLVFYFWTFRYGEFQARPKTSAVDLVCLLPAPTPPTSGHSCPIHTLNHCPTPCNFEAYLRPVISSISSLSRVSLEDDVTTASAEGLRAPSFRP